MALFSRSKETKATKASKPKAKRADTKSEVKPDGLENVLLRPRITEKAVAGSERRVYTFEVHQSATKYQIRDAVIALFKVTPVKVNIVKKSPRQFMSRNKGRVIKQAGLKKAYVYLREGDTINLV